MSQPPIIERALNWIAQQGLDLQAQLLPQLQAICPQVQWRLLDVRDPSRSDELTRHERQVLAGMRAMRLGAPLQRFISMRIDTPEGDVAAVALFGCTHEKITACHARMLHPLDESMKIEVFQYDGDRQFLNVNRSRGLAYGEGYAHFPGIVRFVRHNMVCLAQCSRQVAQEMAAVCSDEEPLVLERAREPQQLSLV